MRLENKVYYFLFMNINWYGQTCLRVLTQENKNNINILIDPFQEAPGFRTPKLEADIFMLTFKLKPSEIAALEKNGFVISGPGEYNIKEIYFQGIQAKNKKNEDVFVYVIEAEGLRLCHMGKFGQSELLSEQIEKIGDIDILAIPIGGEDALNSTEAIKIMSQIEPKIIIPIYYKIPKLNVKLDKLENFLKEIGIKSAPAMPKLSIKKKDIPSDEAKIIVLE